MPSIAEMQTGEMTRPAQNGNQRDRRELSGDSERRKRAEKVVEFHQERLRQRRYRDLTAEKYMLHIDGEGEAQWADIYQGSRITMPFSEMGSPREQNNLLRPLVDNYVAYHTTQPFRFNVKPKADREARERAMVDQALANHIVEEQNWNAVAAHAMYIAAAYGMCPVHAFWRDDMQADPYEPIYDKGMEKTRQKLADRFGVAPDKIPDDLLDRFATKRKGMIDTWVGDPWDTVFNAGATRGSIHKMSYGRVLPTDMVQQAFSHVQGIKRLEGSERLTSASRFQRTAREWLQSGLDMHGSATMYGTQQNENLIALVCQETAPQVDREWPDGRLTIVALKGRASTDESELAGSGGTGEPFLLHDGPLPGKTLSASLFYGGVRFDDVLGKPYVADLDEDQIEVNQLETLVNEHIRRSTRPPLLTAEGIEMDTAVWEDDVMMSMDPQLVDGGFEAQFLELPSAHLPIIESKIQRVKQDMFRKAGWMAASRGESHAGDAAAKVVALARADDTIHGPIHDRMEESVENLMTICWRLFKQYGDVPWLINTAGDEMAYLSRPYIDRTQLSERPPNFQLVSGTGATSESKIQQLTQMVQMRGADGQPLMSTRQFRKRFPDQNMFPDEEDPQEYRERRPKTIVAEVRRVGKTLHENFDLSGLPLGDRRVEMVARMLAQEFDREYPILQGDDIMAHLQIYDTVVQDETEVPIVRATLQARQQNYIMMLEQRRQQAAEAEEGEEQSAEQQQQQNQGTPSAPPGLSPAVSGASAAGTPSSEEQGGVGDTVADLTEQATTGSVS